MKGASVVLGVGLLVVWIVGLAQNATGWLTWLDGVAGVMSFVVAGAVAPADDRAAARSGSVGMGVQTAGLFVLWLVGMATRATPWLVWWTFVFACAYLVFSLALVARAWPRMRQV